MSSDPAKAKSIFLQAVEKYDPDDWKAFLDEACTESPELRKDVEVLLRAHAQAGAFLEQGAAAPSPTVGQPISEQPGDTIGPHKLLQQIGEGGMGVVFMSDQTEPVERRVALKVLPFASILDKTQLTRFKNEARAAASLDHPNVVHVHSVGTERGVHYYAMQFVEGQTVGEVIAAE